MYNQEILLRTSLAFFFPAWGYEKCMMISLAAAEEEIMALERPAPLALAEVWRIEYHAFLNGKK